MTLFAPRLVVSSRGLALVRASLVPLLGVLVACGGDSSEPSSSSAAAIVEGTSPAPAHDFVVALVDSRSDATEACTGVLVAPDVLLTARHCVAEKDTGSSVRCAVGDAALSFHPYSKPSSPKQIAFYKDVALGERLPVTAKSILVEGDHEACGQDVAAVVLNEPVADLPVASVRTTPPRVGEVLTVVGTGIRSTQGASDVSIRGERGDVRVLAVGPAASEASDAGPSRPVVAGEFLATVGFCFGDSGGPALDAQGAVVGLVSRLASSTCEVGPDVYSSVASHLDLYQRAMALSASAPSESAPDGGADATAAPSAAPAPSAGCSVARGRRASSGAPFAGALAVGVALMRCALVLRRRRRW